MSEGGAGIQEQEEQSHSDDFKSELQSIFDPSFSTLGHGTRPEAAQKILKDGLLVQAPDLLSTAIPLLDTDKTYEEQIDQVINKLTDWPHFKLKAVVIIMIPNPSEGEPGGSRYFNSVFEELPEETGYNTHFRIPPTYIRGYIDVEAKKFITNPKFKPVKPL